MFILAQFRKYYAPRRPTQLWNLDNMVCAAGVEAAVREPLRRFSAPCRVLEFCGPTGVTVLQFSHFMTPTGFAILPFLPFCRMFYLFPPFRPLPGLPFSHFLTVLAR